LGSFASHESIVSEHIPILQRYGTKNIYNLAKVESNILQKTPSNVSILPKQPFKRFRPIKNPMPVFINEKDLSQGIIKSRKILLEQQAI